MKRTIICTLLIATGSLVHAASFDCTKATTPIEKSICSDSQLSDLDGQLAQAYKKTLTSSNNADGLKSEQRLWLTGVRNKCQDAACLKKTYTDRITEIGGPATPLPMPSVQNAVTASADLPKANDALAHASKPDDIVPASPTPLAQPSPQAQKMEAPAAAPVRERPEPAVENSAQTSSTPTNPGIGITDVFHVLFSVGMFALIAGMVRPSLAARWINSPTRKRIFGLMLIYLIPVAVLASFTRTPERKAYEASVQQQKEAERLAKRAEQQSRPSSGGGGGERGSRYQNEVNRFVAIVQRAKSSGAMSRNPSCAAGVETTYGEYSGSMQRELQQARANDPTSSTGILPAAMDTAASQLEASTSSISNLCFSGQ